MVEPIATVSMMMITFIRSLAAVLARRLDDQHFAEQVAEHQHGDQRRDRREEQVDDDADHDREGDLLEPRHLPRLLHPDQPLLAWW